MYTEVIFYCESFTESTLFLDMHVLLNTRFYHLYGRFSTFPYPDQYQDSCQQAFNPDALFHVLVSFKRTYLNQTFNSQHYIIIILSVMETFIPKHIVVISDFSCLK